MWDPRWRTQAKPCLTNRAATSRGFSTGSFGISLDRHSLGAYEFTLQSGLAIFKEHFDDFTQIAMQLVQRRALGMCSGETGNVADQ